MPLDTARILALVDNEMKRADAQHGGFNSAHEGYAVLLEELDELWAEIKQRQPDGALARDEALQVAATALRLAMHFDDLGIVRRKR